MARKGARRYAQAVFEMALEKGELDKWQSDLSQILRILPDAELKAWLVNPKVNLAKKAELLSQQLSGISQQVLNLVLLLITRGKLELVADIAMEYQRRLDGYRGIEHAEVTTAVPLDEATKSRLARELGSLFGKKVVIESQVNPGLIGGAVVRIGGKLLDGSTRSKLLALKKALASPG